MSLPAPPRRFDARPRRRSASVLSYPDLEPEVLRLLAKSDKEKRAAQSRAHAAETRLGQTRAALTRIAAQLADLAALLGPDE